MSEQASYSFAKADVANLVSTYEQLEERTKEKAAGHVNFIEISSALRASDPILSSNGLRRQGDLLGLRDSLSDRLV